MHVRELIWSEPAAAVRRLAHLPQFTFLDSAARDFPAHWREGAAQAKGGCVSAGRASARDYAAHQPPRVPDA